MLMDKGSQLRVSSCEEEKSWDAAPAGGHDAMLRWLESYANTLKYQLGCRQIHERMNSNGICLYPIKQPSQVISATQSDGVLR